MSITQVPIRASISVGGTSVKTPSVLSFNVHRRRGSPASFDASVKVDSSGVGGGGLAGGGISISAGGGGGGGGVIFTGIVKGAKITPCWDDPAYVIVTLTGEDSLSLIKGKKYTRRSRGVGELPPFCLITGLVRTGLKSGKFAVTSGGESFEIDGGKTNAEITAAAQGTNTNIGAISMPGAEGSDLKNDLGVKISVSYVDKD